MRDERFETDHNCYIGNFNYFYFIIHIVFCHNFFNTIRVIYENEDGIVKDTYGTVEYGLNEIEGGGGGKYIELPMVDIVAMLSLGVDYCEIAEIIKKMYKTTVSFRTVNRRSKEVFGNKNKIYDELILPVIEEILKSHIELNVEDFCKMLGWHKDTFYRHFGSRNFLKKMIEELDYLDRTKINEYINAKELEKMEYSLGGKTLKNLRRVPLSKWEKWAIEQNTRSDVAEELSRYYYEIFKIKRSFSVKTIYRIYKAISHLLVDKKELAFSEVQRLLRKEVVLKYLRKGKNYAEKDEIFMQIVKSKFNLNPSDKYQAGNLVEKLFKQDRYSGISMTYHQIIDEYYDKS